LKLKNITLSGKGTGWLITGPDVKAYNEPGKTPAITIKEKAVSDISDTLETPPLSVLLFSLKVR